MWVKIRLYKVIFVNKFCLGDGFLFNNSGMVHLNTKSQERYLIKDMKATISPLIYYPPEGGAIFLVCLWALWAYKRPKGKKYTFQLKILPVIHNLCLKKEVIALFGMKKIFFNDSSASRMLNQILLLIL